MVQKQRLSRLREAVCAAADKSKANSDSRTMRDLGMRDGMPQRGHADIPNGWISRENMPWLLEGDATTGGVARYGGPS